MSLKSNENVASSCSQEDFCFSLHPPCSLTDVTAGEILTTDRAFLQRWLNCPFNCELYLNAVLRLCPTQMIVFHQNHQTHMNEGPGASWKTPLLDRDLDAMTDAPKMDPSHCSASSRGWASDITVKIGLWILPTAALVRDAMRMECHREAEDQQVRSVRTWHSVGRVALSELQMNLNPLFQTQKRGILSFFF